MDMLKNYRDEIEDIDSQMAKLFEKRLLVSKKIALLKCEQGCPITDKAREVQLLELNSHHVNRTFHGYYQEFFQTVLTQCKKYQKRVSENFEDILDNLEN